jgi:glycosyltransferase involved in cell wall biosynthesis
VTRALWVTTEPPDRNLGGGSIREAYLLEALGIAVETHLLLVGKLEDQRTRSALAGVTELALPVAQPAAVGARRRLSDLRRVLVEREPAAVVENRRRVRGLGARLYDSGPFDLVCVEHDRLAPLVGYRRSTAERWTLTLHNLPSERKHHELALASTARQRWLYNRELADARRFEARMVHAYDLVLVPSDADAAAVGGDVAVVPNGVDTERFRPTPIGDAPVLVFTGTLSWQPNVDGITWFCREVFPLVRARVPDVRLDVVGREPLRSVRELASLPGVEVHADVPSIGPWLGSARVSVVPIRIGSGTRLKALEAMASGRPVVGTTIGLDGLGIEPGVDALVADDALSFAGRVVDLLVDDDLAATVAHAGAAHARTRFSWDTIGRDSVETMLNLLQRQAR